MGDGNQTPAWCKDLVILANKADAAQALKTEGRSLEDQVMYAWNRPTTDDDLEQFLLHRAKGRFKDYPLIIIGGAHGYAAALQAAVGSCGVHHAGLTAVGAVAAAAGVTVGALVAANFIPTLERSQWGKGFVAGEFREAQILEEMADVLNIHYVDVTRESYLSDFQALWAKYPQSDLMICVCYGCATDLAKEMRNRGLSSSLGKDRPNRYISVGVQWNVKSADPFRDRVNVLAKAVQ